VRASFNKSNALPNGPRLSIGQDQVELKPKTGLTKINHFDGKPNRIGRSGSAGPREATAYNPPRCDDTAAGKECYFDDQAIQ
jgi:hypothetical protein